MVPTLTDTDLVVAFGLETHIELSTATKAFCGCANAFGAARDALTCPTCTGLPGALPTVNRGALERALTLALALGCTVSEEISFARKHYFYRDLPKGFQTTQSGEPLGRDGHLDVEFRGEVVRIEIERIHLEEDAGKSEHSDTAIDTSTSSVVDLNRAGVPLIEVVTRPHVGSEDPAALARAYVTALAGLVRDLGISEARMERGQMRSDVNVSLALSGALGTRSETKNVGSTRAVEAAVRSEVLRQGALLRAGGSVLQETRHYDEATGLTTPGRLKSDADDYRYMDEPDLVPVRVPQEWLTEIRTAMGEPRARRHARLAAEHAVSTSFVDELERAGVLEKTLRSVDAGSGFEAAGRWWLHEAEAGDDPTDVTYLVNAVSAGRLSVALAREAAVRARRDSLAVEAVVERDALALLSDPELVAAAAQEAVAALPDAFERARTNPKALGPLLGWVRKHHPQLPAGDVRRMLETRL